MSRARVRYLCLCLLALAGMGVSLAACGQPAQTPRPTPTPAPPPDLQAVQSWIRQSAVPLKTTNPAAPLDDLAPLQAIVGDAAIVGLGEGSHGSHEFFTMKQRLLEFLVERMGFTLFAMEWGWGTGAQINDYILTGQGDARAILEQQGYWIWKTQEVLDLIEWMRAYNANPAHTQKLHFAGFDCQDVTGTFESIEQYVQMVDPSQADHVFSLYLGMDVPDYPGLSLSTRQQYITKAQQVYDLLKTHESAYEGRSSPQAFALALQNARVILQYTQLYINDPNTPQGLATGDQFRDGAMAENIAWLHQHADGGEKMVLWAHDGHIGAANRIQDAEPQVITMGTRLRQQFGTQYLALGLSFYQGAFNALGSGGPQAFTEQAPTRGSYNEVLGGAGLPLYLLDLRAAPANGPVGQWLAGPYPFHKVSEVYAPDDPGQDDVTVSLRAYFDVIIHIQKVTASQLLPAQ